MRSNEKYLIYNQRADNGEVIDWLDGSKHFSVVVQMFMNT